MQVLVVGAGAVGQAYAMALERAGATVTFYVRPRNREAIERGCRVARLRATGRRESHRMPAPAVIDGVEAAAARSWDEVWLCIPSNGVHEAGTRALLEAVRGTRVVSLTPGLDDRSRLLESVAPADLVTGLIPFLAWSETLAVEGGEPQQEMVVYFPPFSRTFFEGEQAAAVVTTLRRGGFPAAVDPALGRRAPFGTAFLMPLVAELQSVGWRFRGLDALHRDRFRRAVREAAGVVAAEVGAKAPGALSVLPRLVHPVSLRLASAVMPLDLEVFLERHFTKVGAQTSRTLGVYLERAQAHGLGPMPALHALLAERMALDSERPEWVDGG